jgi:hypothetical protein
MISSWYSRPVAAVAAVLALTGGGVDFVAEELGIVEEAQHGALVAAQGARHLIAPQQFLARKQEVEVLLPGGEIGAVGHWKG